RDYNGIMTRPASASHIPDACTTRSRLPLSEAGAERAAATETERAGFAADVNKVIDACREAAFSRKKPPLGVRPAKAGALRVHGIYLRPSSIPPIKNVMVLCDSR